jgi:hypothetical protein
MLNLVVCKETATLYKVKIQGAAEITPTFGGVIARAVEGVQ